MLLSLAPFFIPILCNILSVSSVNDEGLALLTFKQSIESDPFGSLNNWKNDDNTPCSWNGITCQLQKVISISFPNKMLSGSLSPSLGSLSQLRHVNLRSNKLHGFLPPELFRAQGLQSLVLCQNYLSGPLPFEVGKLTFIQTLDLSLNSLNGSLPTSLTQCKRLKNLDLSHNKFTGALIDRIGENIVLLEKLDLSYNGFSGLIPGYLGKLSRLQGTLDLSHNLFNGSIPADLGDLPEKVYIDLTYNNLSGPIPQSGALINRGPTAFIGNIDLCGPPLKKLCSLNSSISPSSPLPYLPHNSPSKNAAGHRLSKTSIIAMIFCDLIGICLVGLLFSYYYSRTQSRKNAKNNQVSGKSKRDCSCFSGNESETLSENEEQCDLVALDGRLPFDLDELLKASAFVLGKSGIGICYRVVLEDGQTLAVRRLGEGGTQRFKEFQTEVEAIGKLRHQNVVTLRAYYWSVEEKLLIYDFIPNGNLATAIHGKPDLVTFNPLPWSTRLNIMKGIAKGLVYLHEHSPRKYVHGNLKPTNVLLGPDMEPRISDFGLGRLANITTTDDGSPTVRSNRTVFENASGPSELAHSLSSSASFGSYYQAPEAIRVVKPSQKWDVYSYGVILLEIITGRPPWVQVGSGAEVEIAIWVQMCIDEKRPLSDVLDPQMVGGEGKEEETVGALKIGMACVHSGPERRPSMRLVADALDRLQLSFESFDK